MATASSIEPIPRSVLSRLSRLRRQLLNWIIVHGLGRWLMVLLSILAFDIVLDRAFKMDFAQRLIMLVVISVVAVLFFLWRVIRPLTNRPNDDSLIYEIEEKNPELNESLISSYQLAREKNLIASGVSAELANATIRRGVAQAEKINFSKSLDGSKRLTNWLILGVGLFLFAILAIGVNQTRFLSTWFNRNILLTNDQWPQATYLEIVGAVDGRLIVPRGSDQRQLVQVTEESRDPNVDVALEVDGPTGRTTHRMKPTGKLDGREHVFVFHNVSSKFRFRASGGDDITDWVQVELVEPPSIEDLQINALLPKYTGIESLPLVGSGPHSVLSGSKLAVAITSNKRLGRCNLVRGEDVIEMDAVDNKKEDFKVVIPKTDNQPLSGGEYEFELIDDSGLASNRPSKFSITIKEDMPPKVRAELLGISGLVVPRAILPVGYDTIDDYGLRKLSFDCSWKNAESGDVDENSPPAKRAIDFPKLKSADGQPVREANDVNVLDLEPLKLTPGTSFRLVVRAVDTRPDPAGVGKSQEFLLRIVTDEELRADLLRREEEQRKAFEQAYNSQLELTSELQAVAAMKPERKSIEKFDADRESRLISLYRDQKLVGTSLDQIATRFEEFLVEVKNNRLDEEDKDIPIEQTIERRFDQKIIQPIRQLDLDVVSLATRNLDNCRRTVRESSSFAEAVDQTVVIQQHILDIMRQILDSMVDSENFQKAVNKLLEIKRLEERLKGEILNRNKPDDIFDPDDPEGIFEDDK